MNDELKQFEEERKKLNRVSIIVTVIAVLFLIVSFVLMLLYEIMLVFVAIIVLLFVIICFSASKKKFAGKIKSRIISTMVKEELGEDAIYDQNGGIPLNEILSTGMYQYPDKYNLEDYIKSSYNGVDYQMCDAILKEKHVTRDSKGNRRVEYIQYFNGKVIIIDFKKDIDVLLKIVEGHPKGFNPGLLQKVETEVIDFNEKFKTYVNDKEKAFYYLTPVFIRKIVELEKLYKGTIQYVLDNDCFYIYINNNSDSLEVNIRKPIDDKQLNIFRSQITIANAIINEFNLDSFKFNNQEK